MTFVFRGAAAALGVSALIAVPSPAQQPVSLSFAQAVQRAAAEAPAVVAAALRTSEAGDRVRQARSGELPSLALSGSWVNRNFNTQSFGFGIPGLPEIVPAFSYYDAHATLTEDLLDFSTRARVRAALAQADVSGADQRVVVEAAAHVAALSYLAAARAAASLQARRADSSVAAELLALAEAQKTAGVSAALDATRARTQLVVAEGLLIVAQNQSDRARIQLARALGLDPLTPLVLADTLSASLGASDVGEDRGALVARALQDRPDLAAEAARGEAARRTRAAITAERLPRLSVEGEYGPNGPTPGNMIPTRQLAVAVTVPLLDGFRREARADEQDAVARESDVKRRDLEGQVAAEVDGALLDLRSASAQQRIAAERLVLAQDELSQARQRFAAGVSGNIDVITAQSSLIQARDADIDARFAAATARVALARAAGAARTLR